MLQQPAAKSNRWRASRIQGPGLSDLFAVFLRTAGLERIGLRHGNDVISGVDKVNLSGDACREIRQEIKPGASQFLQRDATAERRMSLLECEHISRVRNAGAGKRADRPSRDCIDPDFLR